MQLNREREGFRVGLQRRDWLRMQNARFRRWTVELLSNPAASEGPPGVADLVKRNLKACGSSFQRWAGLKQRNNCPIFYSSVQPFVGSSVSLFLGFSQKPGPHFFNRKGRCETPREIQNSLNRVAISESIFLRCSMIHRYTKSIPSPHFVGVGTDLV